jgi:release factor glutamine methyltransferase
MKKRKGIFLEIGTGTGFVALSNALNNKKSKAIGTDINRDAIRNAKSNAEKNGITNIEFFFSDMFSNVNGRFETVCFNPPYLGPDNHSTSQDINFIDKGQIENFIDNARSYLTERGKAYLILSSNNGKTGYYLDKIGKYRIIEKEKYFFEELFLVEFR